MSTIAKTIVATGVSSGLKQAEPYRFIIGARDAKGAREAYSRVLFDSAKHTLTVPPLELSDLKTVQAFARQTLERLGGDRLDYLLLNAAISNDTKKPAPGPHGSKWSEAYIVNHLFQHYLVHLLREKLVCSRSRLVFVSSGAVRNVSDPNAGLITPSYYEATLDKDLKAGSGETSFATYSKTKFVALLGAHWWRRQLKGVCDVVAVSPGMVPGTGLVRGLEHEIPANMPDAKSVPEGAQSILQAFTQDDFPEDPEQIFLTSWGEWWSKDVYADSLDSELQDKWCPVKEDIEEGE